jgi:hypothetical protein
MPIRINLLAEAQALEELRRKDPVKRAMYGAATIVALVVLWSVYLQLQVIVAKAGLNNNTAQWKGMSEEFVVAESSQRNLIDAEKRLAALESLRTNRFLWGTVLNAMQQTLNDSENIRVMHLRSEQKYLFQEGTPDRTNGTQIIRGQPATSTEKISVSIDALDASDQPGKEISRFKESILGVPFFKSSLQQTNGVLLTSLSPPQTEGGKGRPFVTFTLQCFFPVKVR